MNIGSLCRRAIVTIDATSTLREAAQKMLTHHVGTIVVTTPYEDRQDILGLVTDRDLAVGCVAHELDPSAVLVGAIASRPLIYALASSSPAEAADVLRNAGVRRLLVCDDEGQLVGLLSTDDLLVALVEPLRALAGSFRAGIEREQSRHEFASLPAPPQLFVANGALVRAA